MRTSGITATDMFCGAGGSSLGATAAGAEVVLALNHWKLAVQTHNTNFPNTLHDCTDISACDPRRYPSTTMLITSPECTNHSLAKGRKRTNQAQRTLPGMEEARKIDPAEERSRATMFDVPRFAEFHRYELIIVENVVDARRWILFDEWLRMMQKLGYRWEIVYLNSMFVPPTPQSRDRMYVVFWRRGNPAPDLRFTPPAYCPRCDKQVAAVQSWKQPTHPWGRYGKHGQYVYCCSGCAQEVLPFYYAAANAIDWSLPISKIGERKKPLKDKTLRRIEQGLRKFQEAFVLQVNKTSDRLRPLSAVLPTQTGDNGLALASPFLVSLSHGSDGGRVTPVSVSPMQTQTTRQEQALVLPYIIELYGAGGARSVEEPLATVTSGGNRHGLMLPAMLDLTGEYRSRAITAPVSTVVAQGNHHGLLLSPSIPPAFLMPYYGTGTLHEVSQPLGTITTLDRHALVTPTRFPVQVEECSFRMLQPAEIGRAMAFPESYIVLGNTRQKVKQYGNAVTPPVMRLLMQRCIATLD